MKREAGETQTLLSTLHPHCQLSMTLQYLVPVPNKNHVIAQRLTLTHCDVRRTHQSVILVSHVRFLKISREA